MMVQTGRQILNWAMIPTLAGLLLLAGLTLVEWRRPATDLGGFRPSLAQADLDPASQQMRSFFNWATTATWRPLTKEGNPFFTLAIQPPPAPKQPIVTPATRKVELTYRGFFETSARIRRAVVQVADKQILAGKGDKILPIYGVAEIELRHMSLTNGAGVEVKLEFSRMTAIEIPAP